LLPCSNTGSQIKVNMSTTTAEHQEEGEYPDPYSIFKFAMNSSVTGDRYTKVLY
jgi:hypothetical protein